MVFEDFFLKSGFVKVLFLKSGENGASDHLSLLKHICMLSYAFILKVSACCAKNQTCVSVLHCSVYHVKRFAVVFFNCNFFLASAHAFHNKLLVPASHKTAEFVVST